MHTTRFGSRAIPCNRIQVWLQPPLDVICVLKVEDTPAVVRPCRSFGPFKLGLGRSGSGQGSVFSHLRHAHVGRP